MNEKTKDVFRKVRLIAQFVSIAVVVGSGLIFTLYTDVKLSNNSTWLFLVAISVFGSAGLLILSETLKEKKKWCIGLKIASIILVIGFIASVLGYRGSYLDMKIQDSSLGTIVTQLEKAKQQYEEKPTDALYNRIQKIQQLYDERSPAVIAEAEQEVKGIIVFSIVFASLGIVCLGCQLAATIITIDDDK